MSDDVRARWREIGRRVDEYAESVNSGETIAGPHVRDACTRHLKDRREGEERGLWFDLEEAGRLIEFFPEVLRLNGGEFEGEPFHLHPSQAFIVGSLFGWKTQDGYRRFRVGYIEEAKGSGKSPLAAGIGIYMTRFDGEPRSEVYAAAAKRDQAKVMFRDAVAMIELSPDLSDELDLGKAAEPHNISHHESGSFFRPISTEDRGRGQSGPRPHCAILDEVHEHATNAMVEFMRAGTKGRRQALILLTTNSGDSKQSVCWEYHDYGAKVCAGDKDDDSFFAYICGVDDSDNPFEDPSCWVKANPLLGITFTEKYLEEQVRQARGMPSKEYLVRRLNFCQWTEAHQAWIQRHLWEACEVEPDFSLLEDRRSVGGLDLSAKLDLTALAQVWEAKAGEFGLDQDGYVAALSFWTPGDTLLERAERDRMPMYLKWRDDGYLNAPPGKTVSYRHVAEKMGEANAELGLSLVAYDRWRIEDFKRELDAIGLSIELTPFGQGFKDMSPAIDNLEELIVSGRLKVFINPVLRWNVASAVVMKDPAGNRKFAKDKATGRIDGLVALTMAVGAMSAEATEDPSYQVFFAG